MFISPEARKRYVERRQKDFETLSAALLTGELGPIQRIGHQLKGNAASFGYPELEKVAIALELAAEAGDFAEAARQLEQFKQWLKQTSV